MTETRCPKCGSEDVTITSKQGKSLYAVCDCGCYWTSWQQAVIEKLTEGLRKLEWCGTAYGQMGETAKACPVCHELGESLYIGSLAGKEQYKQSKGHKPDCWLNQLIGRKG